MRAQSVLDCIEVDLRLALGGFAKRDDSDFIFILRMHDSDSDFGKQAQRDKALLSVGETVFFNGVSHTFKHTLRVNEIKPVIFDVRSALHF